ncbi:MAG: MFS transporter [Verrucomicrobia bacterium]|jgi:MFS family permease|nr:MAG: MFS transporter [Verrucomicrobiota bacterium]
MASPDPCLKQPSAPKARWGMVTLCFAATAINYLDRTNLSLAVPAIQHEFKLSSTQMGFILSGFFWTYAIMQLPSGWLVDRLGPKIVYAVSVAWWSLFTMATAIGQGMASLVGCRLMLGAGEAAAYPCNTKVTSVWFRRSERAFASSIFDSGSRVGAALAWPIVGYLITAFGWRISFLVTGGLGFIWILAWAKWYRDPKVNEHATDPEPAVGFTEVTAKPLPWKSLFKYRTIWGMMIGFFCLNFVIYFFITWFPAYLVRARGFSMLKVGTVGAIPAMCAVVGGWIGGYASDSLYNRGWSLNAARKTCLAGGLLVSSCIAAAALVKSESAAMVLFCISYASLAFTGANIWCLPADVAPTKGHVASIAGIQNFASGLAGALTTTFTGYMLGITGGSFVLPLVIGGGVCILGALSYLFIIEKIEPLPGLEP